MKSCTQQLPTEQLKADLKSTHIFPEKEIRAGDWHFATSWNTLPNGAGVHYASEQRDVDVYSSFALYARYPSPTCTINYFYTDGTQETESITEKYSLKNLLTERPLHPEFKGWTVDGKLKEPASVYPWYPEETVRDDVNAFMSAWMVCQLAYDGNGGIGSIEPTARGCSKHVDEGTRRVVTQAEEVELEENQFAKEGALFGGWRVGSEVKQPGSLVLLDADKVVIARWLYPATYDITARAYPSSAGTVRVENGSADNIKTLVVVSVKPGYLFEKWTSSAGEDAGSMSTQTVTLPAFPAQEDPVKYAETFTASFAVDASYTQVIYTDGTDSLKEVSGKLTRSIIQGDAAFSAATKKRLVTVRQIEEEEEEAG